MSNSPKPKIQNSILSSNLQIVCFIQVKEDIDAIQRLKILIDYDDNGYLLQVLLANDII